MSAFYLRKLRTYFAATDADKDGVLTENDYRQMAKKFIEIVKLDAKHGERIYALAQKMWDEFLKGSTTDGKSLSQDQLIASITKRRSDPKFVETIKQLLTTQFHEIDVNKDGLIQEDEYVVVFQIRGLNASDAPASFKAIDTNGDGAISLDEFLTAGAEFFTSEDENSPSRLFWGPLAA
jgi:hypothetical protein